MPSKKIVATPTQESKSIKIGNITLPIIPPKTTLVNSLAELETLALSIQQNLPALVRHLASLTQNAFRRLNLNGSTTIEELCGHYTADDKSTGLRWIDGILPEAMKNGYWLCLDEINAALPEILFVLQSVLDDDKFLVLPEHENEVIKQHAPHIDDKTAGLMVRVGKGKASNSLSFICSTRELINWAKLTQFMPVKQSSELALLNKAELASDKKTIEDILKLQVGKWEKKQLMTISDIEAKVEESQLQDKAKLDKVLVAVYRDLEDSYAKAHNAGKSTTKIKKLMKTISEATNITPSDEGEEETWED